MPATDKFLAIDLLDLHFPSGFEWLYWPIFSLIAPLISALVYIYAYPLPAAKVYRYVREKQRELKEIQTQIDDETPMTREESRELRSAMRKLARELEDIEAERQKLVASHKEEVDEFEQQLSLLRQSLAEKQADITVFENQLANTSSSSNNTETIFVRLSNLQEAVLTLIATQTDEPLRHSEIVDRMRYKVQAKNFEVEYALDQLKNQGMISAHEGLDGRGEIYKSTPTGRAFLVRQVADEPALV
jgi:septal ring factor EnvC (AmiA/AmiB activator)